MKNCFFLLITLHVFQLAQSQSKDTSITLKKGQWNKLLNKAFISILGGKGDNSTIGNYASFDPTAGSFTFKGSIPIGRDSSTHMSYLSLTINGDLISDNYAALFTNSKLNTNASLQADWHIRLGKNKFVVDQAQIGQYLYDMRLQLQKMNDGVKKINVDKKVAKRNQINFQYQILNDSIALKTTRAKSDIVQQIVDSLFNPTVTALYVDKKKWTDSLVRISTEIDKLIADSISLQFKYDSISNVIVGGSKYIYALNAKVQSEYDSKTNGLDTMISLKKVAFNWFTLTAAIGRKNYYTYNDKFAFSNQIQKFDTTTWKFGITWNYFNQSKLNNKAVYLNIGIARLNDNNTSLLTTTEISDEKATKNTGGDTTRKITQKYNAYTDSIITTKEWEISSNFYFLFGKRTSGFHLFPSLHLPDGLSGYFNAGIGYIVPFINNKKDQPVINAEGYFQFKDVFNSLHLSTNFWNRNEIGIRFSLPFALLSK